MKLKTGKSPHKCDNPKCGRVLRYVLGSRWNEEKERDVPTKKLRCITGQDVRLTDGKRRPRYCWPGEGCNR